MDIEETREDKGGNVDIDWSFDREWEDTIEQVIIVGAGVVFCIATVFAIYGVWRIW